nr:IS5/IS1182 family transposase [Legionella pneumophila]
MGRKLRACIHLGVYLLQQLFNKTDRPIEYEVKDNAAYQLFCGVGIVEQ